MAEYYHCPFCPRGYLILEYLYDTTKKKHFYKGICDQCGIEFNIFSRRRLVDEKGK